MNKVIFFFAIVLQSLTVAQTYQVGHMSINFKDPSRSGGFSISGGIQMPGTGRDIGTEIYYPSTTAGNNVALAVGQFPVVVIGHGFVMTYDNYDNIYNQLASLGYIVALPRTEGSFSPSHLDFAKDISLLSDQVMQLNTVNTPTSLAVFNGKVKQRSAIGGHSMGAGCSMVGAQNNTTISALFNMATATSNTAGVSSLAGASLVTVPTLILSGERDCVADTNVQNSHFANITASQKFHVILKALTHCDFGNGASTNCNLGQTVSGCPNTISNSLALTRYMNYLVPFLNKTLKDSCAEGQRFMDSVNTNSSLRAGMKRQGSLSCNPANIMEDQSLGGVKLYPNPAKDVVFVEFEGHRSDFILELSDVYGRIITRLVERNNDEQHKLSINTEQLPSGMYILKVSQANRQRIVKISKN